MGSVCCSNALDDGELKEDEVVEVVFLDFEDDILLAQLLPVNEARKKEQSRRN